jgi:sporulation protein YlmC with PRC-barrel domain
MIRTRTATALTLALAFGAGTALAQTNTPGANRSAPDAAGGGASPGLGATTPSGARSDVPSNRNPVLTDSETIRASKVIGSSVYNDKGEKIGSIDDVILDKNHQASAAVLSVGGFLGLGSKLVEVPYKQLEFGDTRQSSENRVKLPGATKDSLEGMPAYSYRG